MLDTYITGYNAQSESPKRYHQWCYLGIIATTIGRGAWLKFGKENIYPNAYIMLVGQAAARKSAAIKPAALLLDATGYTTVAKGKTSKEKFLLDLSGHVDDVETVTSYAGAGKTKAELMTMSLFDNKISAIDSNINHEMLIASDEFVNFIGVGNYEFLSILGELWESPKAFESRVKNSKSLKITNPCVNIMGGITPTTLSVAFPPEIIGQGFMSRLLLIFGEKTSVKTTWPDDTEEAITAKLVNHMHQIKINVSGQMTCNREGEAFEALDWLYKNWENIPDSRFANYSGRRFNHLLKTSMLFAANKLRTEILLEDVIAANTLLTITEQDMPKALGEFGKARNSSIANKILDFMQTVNHPQSILEIFAQVSCDIEKIEHLTDIISNLRLAGKIQSTKLGLLPIKKVGQSTGKYFNLDLIGGN